MGSFLEGGVFWKGDCFVKVCKRSGLKVNADESKGRKDLYERSMWMGEHWSMFQSLSNWSLVG